MPPRPPMRPMGPPMMGGHPHHHGGGGLLGRMIIGSLVGYGVAKAQQNKQQASYSGNTATSYNNANPIYQDNTQQTQQTQQQAAPTMCSNCGGMLEPSSNGKAKFCPYCGSSF